MHERNRYKDKPPDLSAISEKYPKLKNFICTRNGIPFVDFSNEAAVRCVTEALLFVDFNLIIDLPSCRLVPRVPQKLNYIHWIEDLCGCGDNLLGLDIGCGASCIHALLACTLNPTWCFKITETDAFNQEIARINIDKNHLQHRIEFLKCHPSSIFDISIHEYSFAFSMCNPPFYSDFLEAQGLSNTRNVYRRRESKSCTSASACEVIYPGGELEFVKKMINDSREYLSNIQICTTQLGKKSSVKPILKLLEQQNLYFTSTEFSQGQTMRWGIAWSSSKPLIPYPHKKQVLSISHLISKNLSYIFLLLVKCLNELDIQILNLNSYTIHVIVKECTWAKKNVIPSTEAVRSLKRRLQSSKTFNLEVKLPKLDETYEGTNHVNDNLQFIVESVCDFLLDVCENKLERAVSVNSTYTFIPSCECLFEVLQTDNILINLYWLRGAGKSTLNQLMSFIKNFIYKFPESKLCRCR